LEKDYKKRRIKYTHQLKRSGKALRKELTKKSKHSQWHLIGNVRIDSTATATAINLTLSLDKRLWLAEHPIGV